ncbi:MAG: hypothetical protein QM523_03905 [Candidatus Pacebacteria bacterium]|nr:hypothetical protein [Candidatus Paceibacterota bacterium]
MVAKTKKISLVVTPSEFLDMMGVVVDELRSHYPNIQGHSGVKWAGHIAAAIAEQNIVKFAGTHKYNNPHNLQKINAQIAIIFAFSLLNKAYYFKITQAGYSLQNRTVVTMRKAVSDSLMDVLIYKNYVSMGGNRSINPVILSATFEQFMEGRYPLVDLNGSCW